MEKKQVQSLKRQSKKVLEEEQKKKEKEQQEIRSNVLLFRKKQERYKNNQRQWEAFKKAFYDFMEEKGIVDETFPMLYNGKEAPEYGGIRVQRIQKKHIVWDIDELEKRLIKKHRRQVIQKRYVVNDMEGLVSYLKQCGVDPILFKQFIDVEKMVDKNALDNLHDIGEIGIRDIKGCYTLKEDNPYFLVKEIKK